VSGRSTIASTIYSKLFVLFYDYVTVLGLHNKAETYGSLWLSDFNVYANIQVLIFVRFALPTG